MIRRALRGTDGRRPALTAVTGVALASMLLGCGGGGPEAVAPVNGSGMEAAYSFDVGDERQLTAFADNVFVGQVVRQTGTLTLPTSAPDTEVPETQFTVRVVDNLKGRLGRTVRVSQFGGPVDGIVARNERRVRERTVELLNDDPLLKPGETVLLATRYDRGRRWHTIVAQPFADRRVRSESELRHLQDKFGDAARADRARAKLRRDSDGSGGSP